MTKGTAALPSTVVAEQDPVFFALTSPAQGRTADNADLSTPLRSGRDDKGEGGASCNSRCGTGPAFHRLDFSGTRKAPLTPQISPLRCAPVEMTKGTAALPAAVVAEQDPLFIALTSPAPERTADPADLSTPLRSGRDDKGDGGASSNSRC